MVQVDVIWSYAFGASYAAASCRELSGEREAFNNRVYVRLLVFLGALFAPSGLYLLSQFPQWETMQVARSITDMPAWLITLFGVTNVTQGIIGYFVGWSFSRKGRYELAHLNWFYAWVLFWFVLSCGWDTTGWQRFLYDPTYHGGEPWEPGRHDDLRFFIGPVFLTLVGMGAFFVPALQLGIVNANYGDLRSDPGLLDSKGGKIDFRYFLKLNRYWYGAMFLYSLAVAVALSFLVRGAAAALDNNLFGYLIGLGVGVPLSYVLLLKRGRPLGRLLSSFYIQDRKP